MSNQHDDPTHIQSEKRTPNSMPEKFPVYLKGIDFAGADKAPNGAIYKFDSPHKFMKASLVNGSVDIIIRDYPKSVTAEVFNRWLRGTKEYEITSKEEFDEILLETTNQMMAFQ